MIAADLDARVLACLRGGLASARAIGQAEGLNAAAVKNSLERLESRNLAVHLGAVWKALTARAEA